MKHLITIVLILNTIGLVYLILRPNKAVTVDNSRYTSDTIVINTKPVITHNTINRIDADKMTKNLYDQNDSLRKLILDKLTVNGDTYITTSVVDTTINEFGQIIITDSCLGVRGNSSFKFIPAPKPYKKPLLLHVGVSQEFGSISTLSPQLNVGLTKNKYTIQLGYKPFTKQYELGLQYTLDLRKK